MFLKVGERENWTLPRTTVIVGSVLRDVIVTHAVAGLNLCDFCSRSSSIITRCRAISECVSPQRGEMRWRRGRMIKRTLRRTPLSFPRVSAILHFGRARELRKFPLPVVGVPCKFLQWKILLQEYTDRGKDSHLWTFLRLEQTPGKGTAPINLA